MKFNVLFISLIGLTSCGNPEVQTKRKKAAACQPTATSLNLASGVYYETDIKPIMTSYCTKCHVNGKTKPYLETFSEVSAKSNYIVGFLKNNHKNSTTGKDVSSEAKKVEDWIAGGKLEKAPPPPSTSEPSSPDSSSPSSSSPSSSQNDTPSSSSTSISFTELHTKVLKSNCDSCHSGSSAKGDVKTDNETDYKKVYSKSHDLIEKGHYSVKLGEDLKLLKLYDPQGAGGGESNASSAGCGG